MTFSPTVLKLNSRFNAQTIAGNISANRSGSAAMLKGSGYNTYGTLLFTPPRRMGGTPQYMSSGAISRAVNGQNMSFVGGGIPAYSGVSYNQNVTMGTSSAFNTGMGIGATLNLALQLAGGLKELGLFGNKEAAAPRTNTEKLNDAVNSLGGNNLATTVTSDNADVQSLISGMEVASGQDSATLRGAIANAKTQLVSMNTRTTELQGLAKDAGVNLEKASKGNQDAKKAADDAGTQLKSAKGKRDKAITDFAKANEGCSTSEQYYRTCVGKTTAAESDHNNAVSRLQTAKANVTTAEGTLGEAKTKLQMAQAQGDQAAIATAQAEVNQAQAALEKAKADEQTATQAEKTTNTALESAKKEEAKALEDLGGAEKNKELAEQTKNEAQTALKETNDGVKTAEDNLKTAQETAEKAKEHFEDLNSASSKLSAHLRDVETFEKAISKYESKLESMESKENKQIKHNNAENERIDQYRTELDGKDWKTDNKTSKSERKDLDRMAKNNSENLRLSSLSDQSFAAHQKGLDVKVNDVTGNRVYFDNGKQITESEYIALKAQEVNTG